MEVALNKGQMSEDFYGRFQQAVKEIQEQLKSIKAAPAGSKAVSIANEHCLASIAQLSSDVRDANAYLPAHDQRSYSETIKALQNSLTDVRSSTASSSRFKFKKKPTLPTPSLLVGTSSIAEANTDATALGGVMQPADQPDLIVSSENPTPKGSVTVMQRDDQPHDLEELSEDPPAFARGGLQSISRVALAGSSTTNITCLKSVYVTISQPSYQTISAILLRDLESCFVDTSKPAQQNPFSTMTLKGIRHSVIVCGRVSGPIHITRLRQCVIAVSCNQFRMHECSDCQVYLACASNPVVEHCENVQFAPLPDPLATVTARPHQDRWDQIEDFGWLRPEPSPNWTLMPTNQRVSNDVWNRYLEVGEELNVEDLSSIFGIVRRTRAIVEDLR